ncbi:hypothetical protein [Massilia sp. DD77]|uniref:hypothetical protein n=1 Tax=Massilia sp. DD77 TaxID=3109349 RepID=UPI002FFEF162
MNQTPEYLLSPHKAAVLAAARQLMHAAGSDGFAFEIPGTEPKQMIVVAPEAELGRLVDADAREPMLGGRRKSDVPPKGPLNWDEPEEGAPRRWTILLTSDSGKYGLVGEPGATWQANSPQYERVDVLEAGPVLARIAELEAQLAALDQNRKED